LTVDNNTINLVDYYILSYSIELYLEYAQYSKLCIENCTKTAFHKTRYNRDSIEDTRYSNNQVIFSELQTESERPLKVNQCRSVYYHVVYYDYNIVIIGLRHRLTL
jgi:hypothetical protein